MKTLNKETKREFNAELWVEYIKSNLSLRTPLYYGQFVWSQKCQKSYIPYLYNTNTSVKRTLSAVPFVSVLRRFDCDYIGKKWKALFHKREKQIYSMNFA